MEQLKIESLFLFRYKKLVTKVDIGRERPTHVATFTYMYLYVLLHL